MLMFMSRIETTYQKSSFTMIKGLPSYRIGELKKCFIKNDTLRK